MKLIHIIKQNYILILILLVGIFLRLYHLDYQSAWLDEVLVLKESDSASTFEIVYNAVLLRDSTSFLHIFSIYYLGHIWEHSILLARIISATAGILSIFYIYKLGLIMLNRRVGYFAAIFLTLNLFHIEYSQEARSYALLVLFVIIAFYRFYHYIYKPNLWNALYLGIFLGLITNCHPIGLLNIASIFLVLFLILILKKDWKSRFNIIKGGIVSAAVMFLFFWFIYPIVLAASKITSFWIADASFERVHQVFSELAGRSLLFLGLHILAFIFFTIKIILELKNNKKAFLENKLLLCYFVILSWIGLEVIVILVKSFFGISILLSRYMIAILPAMVLGLAISIDLIKSQKIKYIIIIIVVGFSVYNTFYKLDYYNTISKGQFKELADFVTRKNYMNDKVVSRYGYIFSYYINKGNPATEVIENSLDSYITAMKNSAIPEESFWYFDGNSADYTVSPENQIYLEKIFRLKEKRYMFDCWTIHYVLKNSPKIESDFEKGILQLPFKDFKPLHTDESGNLLIFENSTIKSKAFFIPKGEYTLVLNGNSLPNIPIENENAHLKVRINEKIIGDFYLNEKLDKRIYKFKFSNISEDPIMISIEFDNDIAKGELDRNVILYNLIIQK